MVDIKKEKMQFKIITKKHECIDIQFIYEISRKERTKHKTRDRPY